MANYRVALMAVFGPEVVEQIAAQMPEGFELVVTQTLEEEERLRLAAGADFFLVGGVPLTAAVIAAPPNLKLIQKWGVGVDKIDLGAAARRGVPVVNTSGGNAIPVAELTIGLMLSVYRHLAYVDRKVREGEWPKQRVRPLSYQINGKTVGLIGLGNIGRQVAKLLRAFDARTIYYSRTRRAPEVERQLGVEYRPLEALISEADIISLHLPLLPETRHLIDARAFSMMKPNAVVINTARGAVVDEAALIEALRTRRILGAGLDTFVDEPLDANSPLFSLDNVTLTPHLGGAVVDTVPKVASRCFENMLRVLRGEPLPAADIVQLPPPD